MAHADGLWHLRPKPTDPDCDGGQVGIAQPSSIWHRAGPLMRGLSGLLDRWGFGAHAVQQLRQMVQDVLQELGVTDVKRLPHLLFKYAGWIDVTQKRVSGDDYVAITGHPTQKSGGLQLTRPQGCLPARFLFAIVLARNGSMETRAVLHMHMCMSPVNRRALGLPEPMHEPEERTRLACEHAVALS